MTSILGIVASSKLKVSGAYESIATAVGTGSSGTITFSSIPSTYKHLQIRFMARSTTVNPLLRITANGSTTGYAYHDLFGDGSTVIASGTASAAAFTLTDTLTISTTAANTMGVGIVDIHDYASTTKNKTFRVFAGFDTNGGAQGGIVSLQSALWADTSAITSITFQRTSVNYLTTNSVFSLYGIKGD